MPAIAVNASARPKRREKHFTDGRQAPIDRTDRARVMALADAARRRGEITYYAVEILRALLHRFANLKDGRCFPSYERIAEAVGCCERTVGRCLQALEAVQLVTWVNRIARVRERVAGLPSLAASAWRVIRTSNAYDFPVILKASRPAASTKGQFGSGTTFPDIPSFEPSLFASLERLKPAWRFRRKGTAGDGVERSAERQHRTNRPFEPLIRPRQRRAMPQNEIARQIGADQSAGRVVAIWKRIVGRAYEETKRPLNAGPQKKTSRHGKRGTPVKTKQLNGLALTHANERHGNRVYPLDLPRISNAGRLTNRQSSTTVRCQPPPPEGSRHEPARTTAGLRADVRRHQRRRAIAWASREHRFGI